jgi:hypothetical protein
LFVAASARDVLVEGNYLHGNGNVGSIASSILWMPRTARHFARTRDTAARSSTAMSSSNLTAPETRRSSITAATAATRPLIAKAHSISTIEYSDAGVVALSAIVTDESDETWCRARLVEPVENGSPRMVRVTVRLE